MKFFCKTRGAVSIFLVIILVPMMTLSALFVDAGKVSLGKSVASSAGDLALNTALTDYDTDLKEFYGLFATAQDTQDLYSRLEDYYRTCITSAGVDSDSANSYVSMIMSQLGMESEDSEVTDILNMELQDFSVTKRTDATLANPTILKKQIVDFMKYRSPINTGLGFLNSLQSFTTLSKQTELVEKRTEYYKQEQGVMELLQAAWKEINEYNKTDVVKTDWFSDMQDTLNSYEGIYSQDINKKTIKDLYDTAGYVSYDCKVYGRKETVKAADESESTETIWIFDYIDEQKNFTDYYQKSVGGYDSDNLPSIDDIKGLMDNFYAEYAKVQSCKDALPSIPSDCYELQYLAQNIRNEKITNYTNSAKGLYDIYQRLRNAMIWIEAYDGSNTYDNGNLIDAEYIKNKIITLDKIDLSRSISTFFSGITSEYESVMNSFSYTAETFTTYSDNVGDKTNSDTVNGIVENISNTVSGYVSTLENAAAHLEAASNKINSAKEKLTGGLEQAKNDWKNAAEDSNLKNTSMAKQDLAEIEDIGSYLKAEDFEEMISRLNNVAAKLREVSVQIKEYKYDDKYIGDIHNFSDIEKILEEKVGTDSLWNVPVVNSDLKLQADSWFVWQSGNVNISWINDSGYQPKLHEQDKLNLYSYMYSHFNKGDSSTGDTTEKTEDEENGKTLYNSIKEKGSSVSGDKAQDAKGGNISSASEITGSTLPSNGSGGGTTGANAIETGQEDAVSKTSENLSSMFSNLVTSIVEVGTTLRDDLYVSDYILNMFSYDTIEAEYKNKNNASDVTGKIKTLTQKEINTTNNLAYGKEVEYVIYGGNNSSNTTKAYASIYGIRLGFNLIYAFMDSQIRDSAFAIATPISAATLGVIPVPLIQAAIIIAIACCESAIDLVDLKAGKSVALFKNSDTWHCSVKGIVNEAKGIAGEALKYASETVINRATNKLTEMLDKTDEELTEMINNGTVEVTEFIEGLDETFNDMITQYANTAIQQLTTSVTKAIERQRIGIVENIDDYVKTQLAKWLIKEAEGVDTENDLSYIAKKQAVEIIIANGYHSAMIKELSDVIQADVSELENKITEYLNGALEQKVSDIGGTVMQKTADIRGKIVAQITTSNTKILQYKDNMKQKIKDSMSQGAKKLKETVNEQLDGIFGGTQGGNAATKTGTGMASLLSFRYSDYLRLFLMIGLFGDERGVLLRTADVIQVNRAKQTGNPNYLLSNSSVYVEISANLLVKPTLLALPLFSSVQGNPKDERNWYSIEYKEIRGY